MADTIGMKTGDAIKEKTSNFFVEKPNSLFKIQMVERSGQMVEDLKVITHKIDELP